jgi:hypothetical protein
MRYLICFIMLSVLVACEKNTPQNKQKTAVDKSQRYLYAPLKGRVNQHGLYKLVRSGGIINDPSTSTGKSVSKPVVQLVKTQQRIPLIKGAQMYLQFRLWYFPDVPAYVDLRRTLKHPPMTLPDKSISTGSDYMIKHKVSVNQVIAYTGYGFDEDYELVEGDWVFEIWYKDRKMLEQKFTTYWPDEKEKAALELQLKKQKIAALN